MSSFWNLFGGKPGDQANEATGGEQLLQHPPVAPPDAPAPAPAQQQHPHAAAPEARVPPATPSKHGPSYGIDDAIKLMRTLPVDDNVDLVVRVMKKTLESLAVRVPDIIDDATRRQDALRAKVGEHQGAIVQLEREIEARRQEIARLEDALAETTTVRERLQLAEATPTVASTPPGKMSGVPVPVPVPLPALGKKLDVTQTASAARSAPPLPPTFRPKLSSDATRKINPILGPSSQPTPPEPPTPKPTTQADASSPPPAAAAGLPPPIERDEPEEETTVESRDMIPAEKGTP
jgi:hypothetical protein